MKVIDAGLSGLGTYWIFCPFFIFPDMILTHLPSLRVPLSKISVLYNGILG